jgi:hypothetical protein
MRDDITASLSAAYVILLGIPHDSASRHRLQGVLAALRDEMSRLTGHHPEDVQDIHEAARARMPDGAATVSPRAAPEAP